MRAAACASSVRITCASQRQGKLAQPAQGAKPAQASVPKRNPLPGGFLQPSSNAGLPQGQPGEQQQQQQEPLVSPAATAVTLAGSAACGAVAVDVTGLSSLHLLAPLDSAAHSWVTSGVWPDAALQHLLAGQLVSSGPILAGLVGWAAVMVGALAAPSPRLWRALGVAGAMYVGGGGSIRHGDPLLVGALKEAFERVRPSTMWHTTFSFPSGHTTATSFICGTLLFVLFPVALAAAQERQQARQGGGEPGPLAAAAAASAAAASALVERRWQLCLVAAACTGVGRVLADDHWSSDVLAGAFLGAALTAATVQLVALVEAGVASYERRAE